MFSTNPFSHLTSSIQLSPPSNSFLDFEKDEPYFYHHHHLSNNPFDPGDCLPAREKFSTSDHNLLEELGLEEYDEYTHIFDSDSKKKHTSKKDHHSKIHTAQGPRDRRVRLSIEVAKKFFYLQDLLGFDKASKTLDWLFNKSKISINELVQTKKQSLSSTVSDQSEVVFGETVEEGPDKQDKGQKKKCVEMKRKKITRKYQSGFRENQSRADARARARERTKEKLNVKKLDIESKSVYYGDCCSNFWSVIESDIIEESLIEKEISLPSSSSKLNHNSFPNFTVTYEQ